MKKRSRSFYLFVRRGLVVLLFVLSIIPIVFLFFTHHDYLSNPNYVILAADYIADPDTGIVTVGGGDTGTPYYRDGSYQWPPGSGYYVCPGSNGNASNCGNGGGSAFIPGSHGPGQTYTGPLGTINGYALSVTDRETLRTCEQLAVLKTCLDTPSTPETAECAAFTGKQYLMGTVFYIEGQIELIQTDITGVSYGIPSNYTYSMMSLYPPKTYTPYLQCYKNSTDTHYTPSNTVFLKTNDTVTYLVGYIPTLPWFQVTGGGNTYADSLRSDMPLLVAPTLLYDTTQSPLSPGILSAKSEARLADQEYMQGFGNVSSTNWSTNNAMTAKNWYSFYTTRLSQAIITPYPGYGGKPKWTTPAVGEKTYKVYTTKGYMNGDLTINSPWTVEDGEKLIMIVDGVLDIREKITITGNGFVAFIVKNDVTINSSVGTTWDSAIPVVEGVYISGNTIRTGYSTVPGRERFVGKGMFAAKNILLERDLLSVNHNTDTSADFFIYNPAFLVLMPDILRNLSYQWQEVVP